MDSRTFVETRIRRYMAQALEVFEAKIEQPLARGEAISPEHVQEVKREFRKKLQTLGSDCIDLMPSGLQINGFEPVRR